MTASMYKEIDKIKFRGIFNGMCVNTFIENGINYYILIVYTLA